MPEITDSVTYWDDYAANATVETAEEALTNAFGWTQYASHGPGGELLGSPHTALELGSGRGNAVAALAINGVDATGIDLSPAQTEAANTSWSHLANAHFVEGDALDYLASVARQWDAIYSIWGALWFIDPKRLLPLVHDRLAPDGVLVFSHAPAVPGAYGIQGLYANGFKGRAVCIYRWAYEPEAWADMLRQHGFVHVNARIEAAPEVGNVGTLIVQARRGSCER